MCYALQSLDSQVKNRSSHSVQSSHIERAHAIQEYRHFERSLRRYPFDQDWRNHCLQEMRSLDARWNIKRVIVEAQIPDYD